MSQSLNIAANELTCGGYSCVVVDGVSVVYTSYGGGVTPLVDAAELLRGVAVADKVIGSAAAMLCIRHGVSEVYGAVMSRSASELLERFGVEYSFGSMTDEIINRKGDGPCPMESAIRGIADPEQACEVILKKIGRVS